MRKILSVILVVFMIIACCVGFTACSDSDDECFICGGSGYYQKKDCPGC